MRLRADSDSVGRAPFEADFQQQEDGAMGGTPEPEFAAFESGGMAAMTPAQPVSQPTTPVAASAAGSVTSQQLEAAAALAEAGGSQPGSARVEAALPSASGAAPDTGDVAPDAAAMPELQQQQPPPPELPPTRRRAMGVDEEVVHQLIQEIVTGSADVQEMAAEQIRCLFASSIV